MKAILLSLLATATLVGQTRSPYQKFAEPWPDAATRLQRKVEAEKKPLFLSDEPLTIAITANFKTINKDRSEKSPKRYPGTIALAGTDALVPVELSSRGHFRLMSGACAWVPLRVQFKKQDTAGTVFDGQSTLKLVTHCRDNDTFEQHVLREYVPYRIYGLLAPMAFRARLARVTYIDSVSGKTVASRYGMFIEDDGDVARRADVRSIELPRVLFKDLDQDTLITMALFEYMIANTDLSIIKLHNVKLMVTDAQKIHPVPYDFDFSGLVNAPYANPDPRLGLNTVRNRLYRGPCLTEAEFNQALEKFRAKKAEIMALYDTLPDLHAGYRKDAVSFLESFYSAIERTRVKKSFVDGCVHAPGM